MMVKHRYSPLVIQGGAKSKTGNFRLLPTDFRLLPIDFRLWFFSKTCITNIQGPWAQFSSYIHVPWMCILFYITFSGAMNVLYTNFRGHECVHLGLIILANSDICRSHTKIPGTWI
jgi:hypothetical protein